MGKFCLRKGNMSPIALTADARLKFRALVKDEAQGPGDWLNAVRRLAHHYGVPYAKLWAVLYKPPKDISASVYLAITEAYDRQERHFHNVRNETTVTGPVSSALHRIAGAIAGEDGGQ